MLFDQNSDLSFFKLNLLNGVQILKNVSRNDVEIRNFKTNLMVSIRISVLKIA